MVMSVACEEGGKEAGDYDGGVGGKDAGGGLAFSVPPTHPLTLQTPADLGQQAA